MTLLTRSFSSSGWQYFRRGSAIVEFDGDAIAICTSNDDPLYLLINLRQLDKHRLCRELRDQKLED